MALSMVETLRCAVVWVRQKNLEQGNEFGKVSEDNKDRKGILNKNC